MPTYECKVKLRALTDDGGNVTAFTARYIRGLNLGVTRQDIPQVEGKTAREALSLLKLKLLSMREYIHQVYNVPEISILMGHISRDVFSENEDELRENNPYSYSVQGTNQFWTSLEKARIHSYLFGFENPVYIRREESSGDNPIVDTVVFPLPEPEVTETVADAAEEPGEEPQPEAGPAGPDQRGEE